jgi:hypothetical protein
MVLIEVALWKAQQKLLLLWLLLLLPELPVSLQMLYLRLCDVMSKWMDT